LAEASAVPGPGRILTTHAGSLPRPKALVRLYADRHVGKPVDAALLAAEGEKATRWVVERQREAGIDIANNGEQVREAFFIYVARRLSGFGGQAPRRPWGDLASYPEFAEQSRQMFAAKTMVSNRTPPTAVGEVRHVAPEVNEAEILGFKAALGELGGGFADAFITAPSPGVIVAAMQNRYYPDRQAYLDAVADALRVEYEAAIRHGLVLQIDAPDLAMERHILFADEPLEVYLGFVRDVVATLNRALDGLPPERVRLHVCWGNYEGPHDRDVALREVLPILLGAKVGGLVLPFANPRHQHEVKLLKELPLGPAQYLVAGVIDTLTNFVEHPEVVAERLERAADAVGDPARVIAGTDCGFDTAAGMGRVTADVVWAKLRAMREGADLASRRLF
jgi:5-methyltetrahydropteroyltriglutamate--homocysteine methyltransferase